MHFSLDQQHQQTGTVTQSSERVEYLQVTLCCIKPGCVKYTCIICMGSV